MVICEELKPVTVWKNTNSWLAKEVLWQKITSFLCKAVPVYCPTEGLNFLNGEGSGRKFRVKLY